MMIDAEYNPPVKQMRVKNTLSNLRMNVLVATGQSEASALRDVYQTILKLLPRVPVGYRDDSHKVDFLRGAVVGYPWATQPLSHIATEGMSFQL